MQSTLKLLGKKVTRLGHFFHSNEHKQVSRQIYHLLVNLRIKDPSVFERLGDIYFDLFDYQTAIDFYLKALPLVSKKRKRVVRINSMIKEAKFESAQADQNGYAPNSLKTKARASYKSRIQANQLFRLRKYREAIALYEQINTSSKLRGNELLKLAKCYYKIRNLDKAESLVVQAQSQSAFELEALEVLSDVAIARGEYADAQMYLNKVLEFPCHSATKRHSRLGKIYFQMGEIEKSLFHFSQLFELATEGFESERLRYGTLLRYFGNVDSAREQFSMLPSSLTSIDGTSENIYTAANPLRILEERRSLKPKLNFESNSSPPLVSCIVVTMRPEFTDNVIRSFNEQTYPNKELILVLNRADFSQCEALAQLSESDPIRLVMGSSTQPLGMLFNEGAKFAQGEFIAKMDDDDEYGRHYLTSSMNVLRTSGTSITGKATRFVYFELEDRLYLRTPGFAGNPSVRNVSGSSLVFSRELFDKISWPNLASGEDSEFLRRVAESHERIASGDEFDYIVNRRGDFSSHTWRVSELSLKQSAAFIAQGKNSKLILD